MTMRPQVLFVLAAAFAFVFVSAEYLAEDVEVFSNPCGSSINTIFQVRD